MAYEARDRERFFERKDISDKNKQHLKDFFLGFNTTPQGESKFYKWLPYLLTQCDDLKTAMHDEREMKRMFNHIHRKLSVSSYRTIFTSAKTLCREMNGGKAPETFDRVKQLTKDEKRKLLRANNPDYQVLSWEEALKIAEMTNSVQVKALIMTQMEGGLRPGELEALNFNDAVKDGKFIFLKIHKSKTGKPREVTLYQAAPYLNRWLDAHPDKTSGTPLWIMENLEQSSLHHGKRDIVRYTYDAMRQMLRRLSLRAGVKFRPLYMMRHSAIAKAKQDLTPADVGAENFGHDIQYYVNVYGRLTSEQKRQQAKEARGEFIDGAQSKRPRSHVCRLCSTINEADKELCGKCGEPLTLEAARKHDKSAGLQKQLEEMRANQEKMQKVLMALTNERKKKPNSF